MAPACGRGGAASRGASGAGVCRVPGAAAGRRRFCDRSAAAGAGDGRRPAVGRGGAGQMEADLGADSMVRVQWGRRRNAWAPSRSRPATNYFAPGRISESVAGRQLLGHELAHVVQQRQGRVRNPFAGTPAVVQDRALEAEADRLGHRAATYLTAARKFGETVAAIAGPSTPCTAGSVPLRPWAARLGDRPGVAERHRPATAMESPTQTQRCGRHAAREAHGRPAAVQPATGLAAAAQAAEPPLGAPPRRNRIPSARPAHGGCGPFSGNLSSAGRSTSPTTPSICSSGYTKICFPTTLSWSQRCFHNTSGIGSCTNTKHDGIHSGYEPTPPD